MKGIVNSKLIDRCKGSNDNPIDPSIYKPSDEIEIIDIVNGDEYDSNKVWYKLNDGNYVWSGGIEGIKSLSSSDKNIKISDKLINYNQEFLNIDNNYRNNKGSGISIAVLDTGIYEKHPDFENYFNNPFQPSKDFTNSDNSFNDKNGHGTHITGLIGSRSEDNEGIIGIAPDCNIWNLKCQKDNGAITADSLMLALDLILQQKPHIVNMSFNLTKRDFESVESKIKSIYDNGIIMIGAAGENENLTKYSLYPAFSQYVISVGSIKSDFKLNNNKSFHSSLDFIIPLKPLESCSIKKYGFYKEESGSSMATALVSGIVALIIKKTNNNRFAKIKTELESFCEKFNNSMNLTETKLIKP